MTCESFITIVHEVSTSRSGVGTSDREALDHVQECTACAAVLDQQRRLSMLLGQVAASDAELDAPDRIEATVLGAFRLAHGTANVVPMRPMPAVPAVAPRRFSQRWMAAAAAIVVGLGATLVTWQAMRSGPVAVPPPVPGPVASRPFVENVPPPPTVQPPRTVVEKDPEYHGDARGRGHSKRPIIPVANITDSRPVPQDEPQEFVTDFYSLVPASGFAPIEGGQLVRLQVPRASLASLGVPIPVGNPNDSVTADMVMGYDGVAHAIRFVQPNMTDERRNR